MADKKITSIPLWCQGNLNSYSLVIIGNYTHTVWFMKRDVSKMYCSYTKTGDCKFESLEQLASYIERNATDPSLVFSMAFTKESATTDVSKILTLLVAAKHLSAADRLIKAHREILIN